VRCTRPLFNMYNNDEDGLEVPYSDNEEEQAPMALGKTAVVASALPPLKNIWECPQILNFMQDNKKMWTCAWCPNEPDGTRPKPFLGWHGTKAVAHICRIPHESVRLCSGVIPPEYASRYKDLYLRQVMQRDTRKGAVDQLDGAIVDLQDSAVSAISPLAFPAPQ
jgi:hypothetical protein